MIGDQMELIALEKDEKIHNETPTSSNGLVMIALEEGEIVQLTARGLAWRMFMMSVLILTAYLYFPKSKGDLFSILYDIAHVTLSIGLCLHLLYADLKRTLESELDQSGEIYKRSRAFLDRVNDWFRVRLTSVVYWILYIHVIGIVLWILL